MKSDKKVISDLTKDELNPLTAENHDKLATNFIEESLNGTARTFTITDMWNLNKKQRSAREMRRWLN